MSSTGKLARFRDSFKIAIKQYNHAYKEFNPTRKLPQQQTPLETTWTARHTVKLDTVVPTKHENLS